MSVERVVDREEVLRHLDVLTVRASACREPSRVEVFRREIALIAAGMVAASQENRKQSGESGGKRKFTEELHKRDKGGKFSKSEGGGEGAKSKRGNPRREGKWVRDKDGKYRWTGSGRIVPWDEVDDDKKKGKGGGKSSGGGGGGEAAETKAAAAARREEERRARFDAIEIARAKREAEQAELKKQREGDQTESERLKSEFDEREAKRGAIAQAAADERAAAEARRDAELTEIRNVRIENDAKRLELKNLATNLKDRLATMKLELEGGDPSQEQAAAIKALEEQVKSTLREWVDVGGKMEQNSLNERRVQSRHHIERQASKVAADKLAAQIKAERDADVKQLRATTDARRAVRLRESQARDAAAAIAAEAARQERLANEARRRAEYEAAKKR